MSALICLVVIICVTVVLVETAQAFGRRRPAGDATTEPEDGDEK